MLDILVLKSFENAIIFSIVLPTNESLNLLYTSIDFCVNVSFTFCHKLVILSRKFIANPDTDVMILPTNEFLDLKSTRLNSSHVSISYDVFCLKKKNRLR